MTTTTADPDARKAEFLRLRAEGWSLRDIGAEHGLSYERVRQIIGREDPSRTPGWKSRAETARDARIAEIAEWLEANGPVARNRVLEVWDLSLTQLQWLIRGGLPSHLILLPERTRPDDFSMSDIADALRRAWSSHQSVTPSAVGLSHATYERMRNIEDPSSALIVSRYGWKTACEIAGVPSGVTPRKVYTSQWSDEDILDTVRAYVEHCREREERATYTGYERWQQERDDAPSGSLVRIRMREHEPAYMKWGQIVQAALDR